MSDLQELPVRNRIAPTLRRWILFPIVLLQALVPVLELGSAEVLVAESVWASVFQPESVFSA